MAMCAFLISFLKSKNIRPLVAAAAAMAAIYGQHLDLEAGPIPSSSA